MGDGETSLGMATIRVGRYYNNGGLRRGETTLSLINVPARWTCLNSPGHHPYVPRVTRDHLVSNQEGNVTCLDGQVHNRYQGNRAFTQLMRRKVVERPINRVKPRIRVPDSTTPADSEEEQATLTINEVADVDIEPVTSSDSDEPEDGWLEQSTGTST